MERSKIIICDKCNKVVAETKCDICEKDLCADCRRRNTLVFGDRIFCKIFFCSDCEKKVHLLTKEFTTYEEFKDFFDKDEKIKKTLVSQIKKDLILKKLYGEQDEKN